MKVDQLTDVGRLLHLIHNNGVVRPHTLQSVSVLYVLPGHLGNALLPSSMA